MTAVLLAQDDEGAVGPLARALREEGFRVEVRTDGRSALDYALSGRVSLVVVDSELPGIDGVELCRRLRAQTAALPVLVLSEPASDVDAVAALGAGADDYVSKPFRPAEIVARVRALLRRSRSMPSAVNGVRIDAASRRAFLDDEELTLSSKEFDLLRVLVREAGSVMTRDQLMREVWEVDWWSSTKTLDMHISWLRRKLGDNAADPRFITTVRGVGFRFERGTG